MRSDLVAQLDEIRAAGLEKRERVITSPQGSALTVQGGARVVNLCANNYLGLADHPAVVEAAKRALDRWGFGMASVRFICGTQQIHRELEARLASFLGTDAAILYSSCFDANGGVFEALLDERDAIISDALNHASIIDGVRLCRARRLRYPNRDMGELERQLEAAADARYRLVVTDGVFSMDGYVAPLADIRSASGGVSEALLDERDAIISDALTHASIIDGVRLCRARRLRYPNRDMGELERQLEAAADARYRLVVTDGVFSMDGYVAPLADI